VSLDSNGFCVSFYLCTWFLIHLSNDIENESDRIFIMNVQCNLNMKISN